MEEIVMKSSSSELFFFLFGRENKNQNNAFTKQYPYSQTMGNALECVLYMSSDAISLQPTIG